MIAPNSIASRKTIDADDGERGGASTRGYATASGLRTALAARRPDASRTKKMHRVGVASVQLPDRPSPKRLPAGRAFNLRRSVLGAHRKASRDFSARQALRNAVIVRKLRHSCLRSDSRIHASLSAPIVGNYQSTKNAPRPAAPSSGFRLTAAEATAARRAINLWRSVLGAIGTLRVDPWLRQESLRTRIPAICDFFFTNAHILALSRMCST